jgi:uncharacterized membrane protein
MTGTISSKSKKISIMTQMALLTAIIIIMSFTPLGFLKIGIVEITFLVVPVVIGAIVIGPLAGAILGGIFGLCSFIQCFGLSAFGAALLAINPFFTAVTCFIPRILFGLFAGLIYKALRRIDKSETWSVAVASLSGALLNTVFFMTSLLLLFGSTDYIMGMRGDMHIIKFVVAFVGTNGLVEAIVCTVLGFAISKALLRFLPDRLKAGNF